MDLQAIIDDIAANIARDARTIEEKADAKEEGLDPGPFGIAIALADGSGLSAGEAGCAFPIQSIAKVFALELAMAARGDQVFARVGREPSGDPFNSIVDLEKNDGLPRNPFVNAGALVVVDMVVEDGGADARDAVVDFVRAQIGECPLDLDDEVMASEQSAGDLNRAMLSFMKHHDNLVSDPDLVMEAYVRQCAIALDCRGLAAAGRFLTSTTLSETSAKDDPRPWRMRKLNALMMTCGHYDGSGDFAVRVGLPAKSGVGGGILAIAPGIASIAIWSRNLDQHGNSILGVRGLEMLANRTGWSVFGPPRD